MARGGCLADYECYFDASHREEMAGLSGCAFCVKTDGRVLYTHVHHGIFPTSHLAEMHALFLLLQYIRQKIEPGKTVAVFGDADGVIQAVKRMRRKSKSSIKRLYHAMQQDYALTLEHIPRAQNKIAHNLSRLPVTEQKLPKAIRRALCANMGTATMRLDDIIIPRRMSHTTPTMEKYLLRLAYYRNHGQLYREIQVNADGLLLDGYISYLILREHGIAECKVTVLEKEEPALVASV
jgi:ribonuclease HI